MPRFLASAALAGAFVGVAVVLLASVSGPLLAAASPWTKLVQGAVFGIALTLVVFAGAELFTGNVMVMVHGLMTRQVRWATAGVVLLASLVGNFVGSVGFALLVHGGGSLSGPGAELVAAAVTAKDALSGTQLLWRSILCNLLVCLAIWMATRTRSDGAKLAVLWWALLAFIASGFEHSVANMTLFTLGILEGSATWAQLGRNLAWTIPGNMIGGGLLVGAVYAWLGTPRTTPASVTDTAATPGTRPAPTPSGLDPVPGLVAG